MEVEGEYGGPFKLDMVRVRQAKEIRMNERRIAQLQVHIDLIQWIL